VSVAGRRDSLKKYCLWNTSQAGPSGVEKADFRAIERIWKHFCACFLNKSCEILEPIQTSNFHYPNRTKNLFAVICALLLLQRVAVSSYAGRPSFSSSMLTASRPAAAPRSYTYSAQGCHRHALVALESEAHHYQ